MKIPLGRDARGQMVYDWDIESCALVWGHGDSCITQGQVDANNAGRNSRVDNRPNSRRRKSE